MREERTDGCIQRGYHFVEHESNRKLMVLAATLPSANVVLILLPLVVLEVGLVVFSLIDLFRPERRVLGDNKLIWALVIVLVGTIGPIVYLLLGRKQT
jgi:hypothetical protein